MGNFKELKVYQKSYEIACKVYKEISNQMPKEELYGLTSQLKRASTSIPLNIAEGYGKATGGKELIRFLLMARGSSVEMQVLLNFIRDFGYINNEKYIEYDKQYEEIGKMLTGLIKSIKE